MTAAIHIRRDTGNEWARSVSDVIEPEEDRSPGGVSSPGGGRYRNASAGYQRDDQRDPGDPGGDHAASGGDQSGSGDTQSSTPHPSSGLGDEQEDDREAPDFAKSMAKVAAQKERDERNRAPGTWMPGSEDLDRDPEPGDDTEFGTDGPKRDYTSRQLGIRLRPKHWDRLLEAARLYGVRPTTMPRMMIVRGTNAIHDAELRARAREWKESGSE
jgi:hypothetical protein